MASITYSFESYGFSIEVAWAYHRMFLCAYWPMPWNRASVHKSGFQFGPLQLGLINRAFNAEFHLALHRKHHGATLEERIRGAADFTLMSDYSTAEEKDDARAYLRRLGETP